MTWIFSEFFVIFLISSIISAAITYLITRKQIKRGVNYLSLFMAGVSAWNFSSALEMASGSVEQKVFWATLGSFGALASFLLLLIWALAYNHLTRFLSPKYLATASITLSLFMVTMATNGISQGQGHHLIWRSISLSPSGSNFLVYQHGVLYYFIFALEAVSFLASMLLIGNEIRKSSKTGHRSRSLYLFGGILLLAAVIGYGLHLVYQGLDLTPVFFTLMGLLLYISNFQFHSIYIPLVSRYRVVEKMKDGLVVLDQENKVVDINPAAEDLLGFTTTQILGQPVEKLLPQLSLSRGYSVTKDEYHLEFHGAGGKTRFFDLRVSPNFDHRKMLSGRSLVLREVTERKETEAALAQHAEEMSTINRISLAIASGLDMEHILKTLHEQCGAIIPSDVFYVALYDDTTGLVNLSLYYENEYQKHPPRDIRKDPGITGYIIETRRTLYIPDLFEKNLASSYNASTLFSASPVHSYIGIPLIARDKVIGVMSVQSYKAGAYSDAQIRLLEMVAVEAAIAIENARLFGEVQRLAIIDELTGVYNYRGLIELGKREVERSRRFNRPLSVLFFDIDGFRNFNNIYSHATGNLILKAVADLSRQVLRSVDIFTRYGGDEFVVLLPETNKSMALQAANRLQHEIASTKVSTKFGPLGVTISIGLTMLTAGIPDIESLVESANRAEHRAKETGNCVVTAE